MRRSWKKRLVGLILAGLVVYGAVGVYLYLHQRAMIYFPTLPRSDIRTEWLEIPSQGDVLRVWRLNPGHASALIYFGGNAEDVARNIDDYRRAFSSHTVYLVNYRGFGGSTGVPSEVALYADALTIFDALHKEHGRIDVIGRSLGTGVATYLASQRPVRRLVLVTPYDSLLAVAQGRFPIFPLTFMLHDRFDSLGRARQLHLPALILVAENDRVVPPAHAYRLAGALPADKVRVLTLAGTGHSDLQRHPDYFSTLQSFLAP